MQGFGKLFVVATPIGNLEDITLRALETLKGADFVLCEDTRHTAPLLRHYNIENKRLMSYHQHSQLYKTEEIIALLAGGKVGVLVSDAGTPGISDPGNDLINAIIERFGPDFPIVPIPGANAAIAALSVSGMAQKEFFFAGFPPIKKGRNTFFEGLKNAQGAKVLYESPHRIVKTLNAIETVFGPDHPVVVCRELTKMFETIYRGSVFEVKQRIEKEGPRGEFVVIIQ